MAGRNPPRRWPRGASLVAALLLWLPGEIRPQGGGGDDAGTASAPARELDTGCLRAVFIDLLGRPPYRSERGEWLGRELVDLLNELLTREELWSHWLDEELYYFLLIDNFRPASERVTRIPADLASGRIGVRDAIHRIVLSPSFDQRNPGPDTFVTVVMEQLLGVTVQRRPRDLEIGKRLYDGGQGNFLGRMGGSQSDVVRIAIEDERFLRSLVEREYARLLRRRPSSRDVARWASDLVKRPRSYGPLLRSWALSPAYDARLAQQVPQPNRLYVRSLYVDLVDRLPGREEERRMRNALDGLSDPGPLRSVLARLLLDSGTAPLPPKEEIRDPTAWVSGLFERMLGRSAAPEELQAFVTALHDPACRPSTVVYAIVSHPEYHAY